MKGKSELVSALFCLVYGLFTLSFPARHNLGLVIWFGNGVLQLSWFALSNGWKKLSLGLFVCDVVTCLLVSLSLAKWSGVAISIWCLILPVVLLSYWHHYKEKA